MPLNEVPRYLIDAARDTDPEHITLRFANGEGEYVLVILSQARDALQAWSDDGEFWAAVEAEYRATTLEANAEAESGILTAALDGDRRLAESILLAAPADRDRPQLAIQAIIVIQHQVVQVVQQPPSPVRSRRAGKVLRRVFKAVGGGIAVAADIVAPDPTLIVRVASIWGGLDMIIDAVEG